MKLTIEKVKVDNKLIFPAGVAPAGYILSIDSEGKVVWIANN